MAILYQYPKECITPGVIKIDTSGIINNFFKFDPNWWFLVKDGLQSSNHFLSPGNIFRHWEVAAFF